MSEARSSRFGVLGAPRARVILLGLAAAALAVLPSLWPGDVYWINDEPKFIARALDALHGRFVSEGLRGTHGVSYGPGAVWIYAALLCATTDLPVLVALRAALVAGISVLALGWLSIHARRLRPLAGASLLLSPYFWLYARGLWDNSFLIPLGALVLAAWVSFSVAPARWKLALAVLAATWMALIHLMSAPLLAAIAAHAWLHHRAWLRAHLGTLATLAAAAATMAAPYLVATARGLTGAPTAPAAATADPAARAIHWIDWRGFVFPLLGGRNFSAAGIDYFFGDRWWAWPRMSAGAGLAARGCAIVTWIAIPLTVAGAALLVSEVRGRFGRRAAAPGSLDGNYHLGFVCLATVAAQVALDGPAQVYGHPHYHNATWVAHACLLWTALGEPRARPLRVVLPIALAGALLFLAVGIHRSGGTRDPHYGATLRNQIEVARTLGLYAADSPRRIDVANYRDFPDALTVLERLYPPSEEARPRRALRIRYATPDPREGWITVVEE